MAPSSVPPSATASFNSSSTADHSRYAPILAAPVPGRRPEKLRFDLKLLFTAEGGEYSYQEARAKSAGLLGKKWGPPPTSELRAPPAGRSNSSTATSSAPTKSVKKSVAMYEPTVTINTKEALADVFGMYNSPEKTLKLPGSKHAPVRQVETSVKPAPKTPHSQDLYGRNNENTPAAKVSCRLYEVQNAVMIVSMTAS